jgi:lipid-A-disaccharide synthase
VEYVGHPLVEVIQSAVDSRHSRAGSGQSAVDSQQSTAVNSQLTTHNSQIVALLPGSRKQEILKKLPVMLEVSKAFPNHQFIVAKAPGLDDNFYSSLLSSYENVSSVAGKTYDLLMQSKAALVTSGTATLETALFGVPEVVCYKGSFLSYEIGRRLVKVKYISLVNLIMDKQVVKELIQYDMNVKNLQRELQQLLTSEKRVAEMKQDYGELKNLLSRHGNASAKAAQLVYDFTLEK